MKWQGKTNSATGFVSRSARFYFKLLVGMLLLGGVCAAMIWPKQGNPFERIESTLKTADHKAFNCLVILPKPTGKHPVVIYFQGAGGGLLDSEVELRRFAELGIAAVCLECDPTNQTVFDEQLIALHQYLQQRSWAQSNATVWVGLGLGAKWSLAFAFRHAEFQPQLMVDLGGWWNGELGQKLKGEAIQPGTRICCPMLLVNAEQGEVVPMSDVQRFAGWLRSKGAVVDIQVISKSPRNFGEDGGVVMRAVAEYCSARLALPDYTENLKCCQLNFTNRKRFNVAMQRAGQRRPELWRAVSAAREPERDTMMNVIGGLEDYDLAHISATQLKECVFGAWQARRKYPWCRDTPIEIFDRFVANPRIYEEPLEDWSDPYGPTLGRVVKYCHTTAESSDALWNFMRVRALKKTASEMERTEEILSRIRGDCYNFSVAFTGLARTVGLPVRPAWTFWPTIGNGHFWNEVWSVEEKQWHAFDASALNRSYNVEWLNRVQKSVIQVPTGERGAWNALEDKRWECLTNSIGLFSPSGQVLVRVLDGDQPAPGLRVGAQVWLGNGMGGHDPNAKKFWEPEIFILAAAITDKRGEVHLVLGQSAEQPYRIFLDTGGESDWEWLWVQSNRTYTVTLETGKLKAFNVKTTPPPLSASEEKTL